MYQACFKMGGKLTLIGLVSDSDHVQGTCSYIRSDHG